MQYSANYFDNINRWPDLLEQIFSDYTPQFESNWKNKFSDSIVDIDMNCHVIFKYN